MFHAATFDGSGFVPDTSSLSRRESATLARPDFNTLDDRSLAVRAAQGQDGAFREIVRRYERPVFSLILRMVRDHALAEDLAQETFLKAFRGLSTFNPSYKFSNWIFKIANNLVIDHLRRRKLDTRSIDGAAEAHSDHDRARTSIVLEDPGERPDDYVEHRELGSQIEWAIGQLRPEYRSAILLRHVEGLSYEEIADTLQLPLGTVKTYIHRARGELKELLENVA